MTSLHDLSGGGGWQKWRWGETENDRQQSTDAPRSMPNSLQVFLEACAVLLERITNN